MLLMLIFLAYKNFHHAQLSNHLFFLVSSAAQDFFIQLRCENEQKETSKTGLEQRMNPVCSVCFIINEKPLKSLYAEIRKATKQSRQWSRAAIAFSEFSDLLNDRSEYSWADGGWINVNLSLWMFLSPALVLVFINFSMSAVEFVFNVEREIKVLVGTALEVFFFLFFFGNSNSFWIFDYSPFTISEDKLSKLEITQYDSLFMTRLDDFTHLTKQTAGLVLS